jgi:hypothetical protein
MGTSIGLSTEAKNRLSAFKRNYKLRSYECAIDTMLRYIEVAGDDPTNPKFTAKAQLQDMDKRLNQVIAFIRTFEKQELKPLLAGIEKMNRQLLAFIPSGEVAATQSNLQQLATKAELKESIMALSEFLDNSRE